MSDDSEALYTIVDKMGRYYGVKYPSMGTCLLLATDITDSEPSSWKPQEYRERTVGLQQYVWENTEPTPRVWQFKA